MLIAPKGFGKAAVGQAAAQEALGRGLRRVLVVAPLKVCQLTWASEWTHWTTLWQPDMAIGPAARRRAVIDGGGKLVVINFENLKWLFEEYGDRHGFAGLVVDESTKLKAAGGTAFKALRRRLKDFSWRVCMTADPVAEQGADIYTQVMIADGGAALGRSKERFLNRYFYPTDYFRRNWALRPGGDAQLAVALRDVVYVVDDPSYTDQLPELLDELVKVEMPQEGWDAYEKMREELYVALGGQEVEAANEAVVVNKLLQITSGAVYGFDSDGERGVTWIHHAKLNALKDVLERAQGPVLVAYQFQFELDALRATIPGLVVLGDDPEGAQARWNAGAISVLAIHPKSAAHGLNLQYGGCELVLLSPILSADANEQLLGRVLRRGQRSERVKRTLIYVPGTIDEVVIAKLLKKKHASVRLNKALKK